MEKNVSKFDEAFIKNYDEDGNKGNILEVDVEYPKDLHNLHSNLPLLSESSYKSSKTSMESWIDTKKGT